VSSILERFQLPGHTVFILQQMNVDPYPHMEPPHMEPKTLRPWWQPDTILHGTVYQNSVWEQSGKK
jgi:hypothetical protein